MLCDSALPNVYSGEKYYIPGKLFLRYLPICIRENVKTVFISFGGADPQNYTDVLLSLVSKERYKEYKFLVALGRAKHNVKQLLEYNEYSNIDVFYDISNMPELMSKADVGFASCGRTCYELALLGIPTVAMAENNREDEHNFMRESNGFKYLGIAPNSAEIEVALDALLESSMEERLIVQKALLSHDIRDGRERVMKLILGKCK